jgi:hypothetical protein
MNFMKSCIVIIVIIALLGLNICFSPVVHADPESLIAPPQFPPHPAPNSTGLLDFYEIIVSFLISL